MRSMLATDAFAESELNAVDADMTALEAKLDAVQGIQTVSDYTGTPMLPLNTSVLRFVNGTGGNVFANLPAGTLGQRITFVYAAGTGTIQINGTFNNGDIQALMPSVRATMVFVYIGTQWTDLDIEGGASTS